MSALGRALAAEQVKLRHTLAAWMVVLAPMLVVLLSVLQISLSRLHGPSSLSGQEAWMRFASGLFVLWVFLMLPLFVTLQAALLANMEHGPQTWKHLLALSLPRWSHYAAKLFVLAAMVVTATALLALATPLAGWVIMHTQPAFGIAGPAPWRWLAVHASACVAAAGLMIALQAWVAMRWQSFTTSVFVGVAGTVAGFLIGQSARFGPWFPWSMPVQVLARQSTHLVQVVVVGLVGGVLMAIVGLWQFDRGEAG